MGPAPRAQRATFGHFLTHLLHHFLSSYCIMSFHTVATSCESQCMTTCKYDFTTELRFYTSRSVYGSWFTGEYLVVVVSSVALKVFS